MQVLDQGDAGLVRALGTDQSLHPRQELALARLRVHPRRGTLGVGHREEVEDQRQLVVEALVQERELAGDPLARRALGVPLTDLEVGAQELEHRQERDGLGVGLACDVIEGCAICPNSLGELVAETTLADARLADDPDHLPLTGERLLQGAL